MKRKQPKRDKPPTSAIIGVGIAGASLAYGVGNTISQNAKANAIQKSLKTPVDEIPAEFYQNREIARQLAQVGIPQQQYNTAVGNINQTQAAALDAASKSANPGAGIAGIVRQGDQAKATLDAEDAQARENNQRYFIQQNATLGARKDQQEQTNLFDPYTRDFNLMQAYRGAGQTTLNNTVNAGLGLGQAYYRYKTPGTTVNPNELGNPMVSAGYSGQNQQFMTDPITGQPYQLGGAA